MFQSFKSTAMGNRMTGPRILLTVLASFIALLAIPAAAQATNVFAAASLRDAFPEIDGSSNVTYNFAGSGALQKQIEEGAPADVFASASPDQAQALFKGGHCERPVTFVTNEVAILVPKGNPSNVESIYSFETGNRKLAIGVPGVPIGDYTREVLGTMDMLGILETNTVSEEPNVTGITAKVASGDVDAGFAYVTDGMLVADQGVEIIRLPEGRNPKVRYQICVVKRDGADAKGAEAFIEKVTSTRGRGILSKYGFGLPPDPAEIARKQQKVKKANQRVKKVTKSKNNVCRKATGAKKRGARNARRLRTQCSKAKKNVNKAKKNQRKAKQDLKKAQNELKNF